MRDRARRGLSARQELLLLLARAYETSFGKRLPKMVNPVDAPFVRFALWACCTLTKRMVELSEQTSDLLEYCRKSQWMSQIDLPDDVLN